MKAKFETEETRKYYFGVKDIAALVGCGKSTATNFAREWNRELAAKGVFVIAGKVPRDYVLERLGLSAMAAAEMAKEAKAKNGAAR